jgi:hypothetical protein
MNRRAFVTGLGAVLAAPRGVEAQQPEKIYRIGVRQQGSQESSARIAEAFRRQLRELGSA